MGVDLYCKFKEPLTAAEIGHWAGETLTDDDLNQILENIRAYHNERDYDKQSEAWDKCHETDIATFVFDRFFSTEDLSLVILGRRWWYEPMRCVYPGDMENGLPYTDSIADGYSRLFMSLPLVINRVGNGFPYIKMDHLYWG